jgi:hypothetical protein
MVMVCGSVVGGGACLHAGIDYRRTKQEDERKYKVDYDSCVVQVHSHRNKIQ